MALNWNWKTDRVGYITYKTERGSETRNLYSGNALLIEIWENEDNTQFLTSFFLDTQHMNNCLGLNKGYDNIFDDYEIELTLFLEYKETKKIVNSFLKAKWKKPITIKVMNQPPFET